MSKVPKHHSDWAFLVFYLTSKLNAKEKKSLLDELERGGEFKDRIVTVDWPHVAPGSEEDIKRLLYQASVEGKPFQSGIVGFIDDQTMQDNKLLMVESINLDGQISHSRRMLARYMPRTAVTCSLAIATLEEAVEED